MRKIMGQPFVLYPCVHELHATADLKKVIIRKKKARTSVMWWGRWTVVSFVLLASSTSCRDCGGGGKVAFSGASALHTTRPLMMMCLRGGSLAGEGGSSRTSGAGEDGRFERDGSLAGSRYVNFLIQDGNSVSACLIRLRAEVADSTLSFGSRQRSESLLVE